MCVMPGNTRDAAPVPEDPAYWVRYDGPGPWYACRPDSEVKPRMALKGPGSVPPSTMIEAMQRATDGHGGEQIALLIERPIPPVVDGKVPPALPHEELTTWTYREYQADVRQMANAFLQFDMAFFETVNIWGFNAPEWAIAALAAMHAGGKSGGIYPTDTPETAAYKVVHSQGSILVVDDREKIDRLQNALSDRGDCRRLKAVVSWASKPEPESTVDITGPGRIPWLGWAEMMEKGNTSMAQLDQRISVVQPGHCSSLIYTSGTTGEPKAVMISHDNIFFMVMSLSQMLDTSVGIASTIDTEERILSYLPMSHIAGFAVDVALPIITQGYRPGTFQTYYARPYDLKQKAIKDRLQLAKPTLFLGVPLVWEKIADQIKAIGASVTGFKRQVADAAKSAALSATLNQQIGGSGNVPLSYSIANALILSKIKTALGLQECKVGLTGAAPIAKHTLEYFGSLGLPIMEIYGMSECAGAATISLPDAYLWGSVGFEILGTEIKIFKVDPDNIDIKEERPKAPSLSCLDEEYQGEICFRSRSIMMGYLCNPDMGLVHCAEIEKKTKETIDAEGWLHSGDKGMLTVEHMLKITGRYKELIIGEGGENIAPVPIEDAVKCKCDGIAEVMMVGDMKKYNVALVTLKAVGANGENPGTDVLDGLAKNVNPGITTISAAMDDEVWIDSIRSAINAANSNGKCCPNNAFKIQKFMILPTNFSEETGELTPTKKLKRKVVEQKYETSIAAMYSSTDSGYIRYAR